MHEKIPKYRPQIVLFLPIFSIKKHKEILYTREASGYAGRYMRLKPLGAVSGVLSHSWHCQPAERAPRFSIAAYSGLETFA
jgi:hypothetical protein